MNAVILYYILTFIISWGGVLALVGPTGIPATPEVAERLLPIGVLLLVAGPFISGLFVTGVAKGKAGYQELLGRLLKWRINIRWYAIALLLTPVIATGLLFTLSLLSPMYLPGIYTAGDKISLLLIALIAGLVAGIFEETGWTGFVLPRLREKYSILKTGLIIGFLWGVWHYIAAFWGSGTASGELSLTLLAPQMMFYIAVLPAYRVLMVWVYEHTESLLLSMIMHGSLTANTIFILMPGAKELPLTYYHLLLGVAFWVIAFYVFSRKSFIK